MPSQRAAVFSQAGYNSGPFQEWQGNKGIFDPLAAKVNETLVFCRNSVESDSMMQSLYFQVASELTESDSGGE